MGARYKHNHAWVGHMSPTYQSWRAMLARCRQPKNNRYARYGGRGIQICDRWMQFENFLADMGARPPGTTLDRKYSDQDYCKENCRWATPKTQARNHARYLTIAGQTLGLVEWSARTGIRLATIHYRLSHGWPAEKILIPPTQGPNRG